MSGSDIRLCLPCKPTPAAEYQDSKYGKQNRVQNIGKPKRGSIKYTCTVCGTETER